MIDYDRFGWLSPDEIIVEDDDLFEARGGDDDHFYGPWNSGSGGRGGPMSMAQQKAAAKQADRQHDQIAADGPDATGQIIPVRNWREPPPKLGVNKGTRKVGGYSSDAAYGTNTVLGRVGEAKFATLLHGRILHPPGHGEQSPLDVKVDGYGFEVKASSTKATSYKATPKKYEIAQKEAFAKELGVKPAIAIVVLDSATDTAFMYWRPGLKGGRLSQKTGWNYLGAVQGAEIIESLREEIGLMERADDDHFYGPWNTGSGGRGAPQSTAQIKSAAPSMLERLGIGLSSEQKLAASIAKEELALRRVQGHEEVRIMNENGKVLASGGGGEYAAEVKFREDKARDMRVILHNHPTQDTPPSPQDMDMVFKFPQVRQMRVVSPRATYVVEPKADGKWGMAAEVAGATGEHELKADQIGYRMWVEKEWPAINAKWAAQVPTIGLHPAEEGAGREFWEKAAAGWRWKMTRIPHA